MDAKRFKKMTLRQLKITFLSELDTIYPKTEIESFFYLLAETYLGLKRIDIALNIDDDIAIDNRFRNALSELIDHKPIQYIIGNTEFFSLDFIVNKHVLIPRPETEELVDWIISDTKNKPNTKKTNILDIGTGSGCIAISLAKNLPNTSIYAIDISKEALKVAKKNAINNDVIVTFIEDDILNSTFNTKLLEQKLKFDIIVSNPPYVRLLEKELMQNNVLKNEPHSALFVANDNALIFYDKIADFAINHLKPNGEIYFEINQYLGNETMALIKNKGFKNVKLKKDIFNTDRMIKAIL